MKETTLEKYFTKHLNKKGFELNKEIPFLERKIDIVGFKKMKTYSFELKVANWKKAYQQALSNLLCSDYSTIVMYDANAHLIDKSICVREGIGITTVNEKGKVKKILKPKQSKTINPSLYRDIQKNKEGNNDLQTILSVQLGKRKKGI